MAEEQTVVRASCAESGMDEILQKYAKMVYRVAYTRTKNAADADDVMQDVFLKYIKSGRTPPDGEHLKAWLIRVAINQSNNLLKSVWFKRTAPLDDKLPAQPEQRNDVLEAVLALPVKYRTAVHLFYYEELSVAEIGRAMRAKEATVRSWLMRARKMLKQQLEEDEGNAG